jgi:hypothetical protein
MQGRKMYRYVWSCIAIAAVFLASQTANSAIVFGTLNTLSSLNGGFDATISTFLMQTFSIPASELGTIAVKIVLAGVAGFMGLVLIARVIISRALAALLDS